MKHFGLLFDQFEYMCDMTNRLGSENLKQLRTSIKEDKAQGLVMRQKKQAMVTEIKGFIELYQTYTINDYDYWNYKDAPMFSLFVEKFEKKAQDLDGRSNQLILGIIEEDDTEQ